ncbi:hypothetical protein [Acididesulfobacillus acetoxydans]|uniref:hypothetical protein n=1 Tax=Acididesulfobacillus acetoxydans TaxID=1561005 RepID=UPI001F10A6F5|nr:hypothetical protein [Acididesulfobacillus acetoxydans]
MPVGTLNSRAYSYHQGNVTTESNLLGVADNRILNGSFEQLSGSQPVNWTAYTPSGAYNQVDDVSVTGTADSPFADSSGNSHVLHINPGTYAYAYLLMLICLCLSMDELYQPNRADH